MLSDLLLQSLADLVDEAGEGCETHKEAYYKLLDYLGVAQSSALEASLKKLGTLVGRGAE